MRFLKESIIINLILVMLLFLSILFIDRLLASFTEKYLTTLEPLFFSFTEFFDNFFFYIFWFLLGCLVLGLFLLFINRTKRFGFVLLTLVFTHVGATAIVNIMKSEFRRARPELYLNKRNHSADFYNDQTKDYSFPSSHTAFYLSLFLPFALIFRKYAHWFLLIPAIIILGRVIQNEHYLSDVICSIIIVFDICLLMFGLLFWAESTLLEQKKRF